MPTLVYIGLGSNLGDRELNISRAVEVIDKQNSCTAIRTSSIYETDPMGPQNQPDYLNAVCAVHCSEAPHRLLQLLQAIEIDFGRIPGAAHWSERTLDLDILMFGTRMIESADLKIPHPGLAYRSFVLWPLAEIDPDLQVPGVGPVRALSRFCQPFGIRPYAPDR